MNDLGNNDSIDAKLEAQRAEQTRERVDLLLSAHIYTAVILICIGGIIAAVSAGRSWERDGHLVGLTLLLAGTCSAVGQVIAAVANQRRRPNRR